MATAFGQLYRSDRLRDLTDDDHLELERRRIGTVVDLRYAAEVAEDPSRLWPAVDQHVETPMGGELADQRSFIQRVLDGDYDEITDADVAESYLELLATHGSEFGAAVEALLSSGPGLFHCTAGKDRTGLLAMMLLRTAGVADTDVITDFELSNRYRADRRIEQLRPTFVEAGLDIERFRPALSAPRQALIGAMTWIDGNYGSPENYLEEAGGLRSAGPRIRERLVPGSSDIVGR